MTLTEAPTSQDVRCFGLGQSRFRTTEDTDMSETDVGRRAPGVYWMGDIPAKCHICNGRIRKTFVDGRTKRGWVRMDQRCHGIFGYGFGAENGQRYELQEDTRRWLRVEG